jgi:hypothetical protein
MVTSGRIILIILTSIIFSAGDCSELFPRNPASEPVPAFEPIYSEEIPVRAAAGKKLFSQIPASKSIPPQFEQIFVSLCSVIINILIFFMVQWFLRQFWHRQYETEEKQQQLRILLQDGEILLQQLKTTMDLMGEVKAKCRAEFQIEMDSLMMNMEDKRSAQIHEEMESTKKIMDAGVLRERKKILSRIPRRLQTKNNCAGKGNLRD